MPSVPALPRPTPTQRRDQTNHCPATATPGALLDALAAGEPDAMERIMATYRRVVYSAARRVLRSGPDIEDVAQDTWLALAANAQRIRNPDRLPAWLWATATNAALAVSTQQRRHQSWDCSAVESHTASVEEDVLTPIVAQQRQLALRAALSTISASERELISLLVATARPSYRDVSRTVGRPIGSLGPTRLRILAKLRVEFERVLGEA